MKRKVLTLLLCLALLMTMPITASADIGPKPSVQIEFTGIEGQAYYGTLLSLYDSTGPASAWDGDPEHADYRPGDAGYQIWKKFVEYEDSDGYYFLQEFWNCSNTNQLNWTYFPPENFKVLLYFPATDSFYVSQVYERYAFDSYFTVDLSDYDNDPFTAQQFYDYTWEIISLIARIVLTIALELGIALLFGYREKRVLAFLASINVVTQIALNVALNVINYHSGALSSTVSYVVFEILVFAVEAVAYAALVNRFSAEEQKKGRAVAYAFVANAASFACGLLLAHLIPGIF